MKARHTNVALDAVRTVAAFLVVLGHLQALFFVDYAEALDHSPVTQIFYLITSLGHPAVIVFFVLSGYWVGGQVVRTGLSNSFSWRHYLTSRLTRLWLVLIPAVVLTQVLDRAGSLLSPHSDIYSGSSAYHTVVPVNGPLETLGTLDTVGNIFFLQSVHVPVLGTNTPLWSLAYEFWYYIVFAAAFLAIRPGATTRYRLMSIVVAAAGLAIAGVDVALYFPIWLAGAALAWRGPLVRRLTTALSPVALVFLRMLSAGLLLGACGYSVALGSESLALDYAVGCFAVLFIGLLLTDASKGRRILSPISSAAEWSYSLYATHLPILAFLASLVVPLSSQRWQLSITTLGWAIGVAILVSLIAWSLSLLTEAQTSKVRGILLSGRSQSDNRVGSSSRPTTDPLNNFPNELAERAD